MKVTKGFTTLVKMDKGITYLVFEYLLNKGVIVHVCI